MDQHVDRRFLLGGLTGVAGVAALTHLARGGPLNPPAGGVSGTGKTLREVEPRTAVTPEAFPATNGFAHILSPGVSYYLTADIVLPAGVSGVYLPARSSLDMNGFTISGTGSPGQIGVQTDGATVIRNGRIRNCQYGVFNIGGGGGGSVYCVLEDLHISGCTVRGARLIAGSIARRCFVADCSPVGVECVGDQGVMEDCTVVGSSGPGAYLNSFSLVRGCRFLACGTGGGAAGGAGAYVGYGSRVERCEFDGNSTAGLRTGARCTVESCSVTNTTLGLSTGIVLDEGGSLLGCVLGNNTEGVRAGAGCRVSGSSFDGHSVVAFKATGSGVHVDGCTFTRNASAVELIGMSGCAVTRCTLLGNTNTIAINNSSNLIITTSFANAPSATSPLVNLIG